MYNILEHRKAVEDNIKKAFGNTLEDIEKAKWQIGEVRVDSRGIAHECFEYVNGKPHLRRVKKNKGANNTSKDKSTESKTSVDISKISNGEFKEITKILEKKNPDDSDAFMYLESEEMNDKELANFIACAKHFKNDTKNINETTRKRCAKWEKLGEEELNNRKKNSTSNKDKNVSTSSTNNDNGGNKQVDTQSQKKVGKVDSTEDKKKEPTQLSECAKGDTVALIYTRMNPQLSSGGYAKITKHTIERVNKSTFEVDGKKFYKNDGTQKNAGNSIYGSSDYKIVLPSEVDKLVKNGEINGLKINQNDFDAKVNKADKTLNNSKKKTDKEEFTESSFKNSFDSIISNISSIINEVYVEKPVGNDYSTVDKTYKTSDWKKGVHVVGDAFYGKDELLQLNINKKGGDIETIQLRKPISNGMGSMYNNQPIGHVIVEVALRSKNGWWLDFDMTKESGRKDFAELLNKNIKK